MTIFAFMVTATVRTAIQQPLITSSFQINADVMRQFHESPWAVATLYDAYCGFITFFVWVCFKERSLISKAIWFVLIMGLGNIAMSAYVLIQLFRLPPGEPLSNVLLKKNRAATA